MLNFKDWEKVSGDDKTSTLKHHKGHIMTIAHDALPKIQMEQLKRLKMAEGGKVESGKQRFDNEKGVHADPGEGDDGGMSMAGVFSRHAKDEGVGKESKDRAVKEHKRVLNEQKEMQKKDRKYLDEGTPDEPLSSDQKDSTDQSIPGSHDTHITINAAPAPAQPPVQPAPPQNAQAQMVSQDTPEQVKAAPVGGSQVITNPRGAAASSIGTENKALQEQQAIDSQKAQMEGQSDVALVQQQNQIAQQAQENFNELKGHTDDFAEHVKSIDPDRLLKNMGLGQKIATSLSLILGGAAGKGRSNMALDDLNKRIDRDVAAQQADINNKHTVFGAYEHLYGDSVIATNLAKVSANDIALTQAKVIRDKLGTQQAQENYDLLAGKLGKENTQLLGMAAKIKTGIQNGTIVPRGTRSGSQSGQMNKHGSVVQNGHGASGSFMNSAEAGSSSAGVSVPHLLNKNAEQIYQNLKYDPTKTPQQIADIQQQYNQAVQVDKALKQINDLYPELVKKATVGGYLSHKVNPNAVGAVTGALGEGIAAGLTPVTGGASLVAALPAGIASTAGGVALGHALKAGARAVGGQQETEYETAKASLIGYIGSALAGTNVTPTEIANLAEEFIPTKVDSEAVVKNKLSKLQDKIINLAHTSALESAGMINKNK